MLGKELLKTSLQTTAENSCGTGDGADMTWRGSSFMQSRAAAGTLKMQDMKMEERKFCFQV